MGKKDTVINVILDYVDYATVHGIGRVKNSSYILLRILWIFALLGAIGMVSFQISRLYENYKSVPIATNIKYETRKKIEFPGVTICNRNPALYSHVKNQTNLMTLLLGMVQILNMTAKETLKIDDDAIAALNDQSRAKDLIDYLQEGAVTDMERAFKMRFNALSDLELEDMSQLGESFISFCALGGVACSSYNFSLIRTYDYGMCHTLPPIKKDFSQIEVSMAGPDYGLELLLNVDVDEYVPFVSASEGVYILIHEPGKVTSVQSDGIVIPTGTETNIAVSVERHERVKGDDDRCTTDTVFVGIKECMSSCLEKLIFQECNCSRRLWHAGISRDPFYNNYDYKAYNEAETYMYDADDKADSPSTDFTMGDEKSEMVSCGSWRDFNCIRKLEKQLVGGNVGDCSHCKIPCKEVLYQTKVSSTEWSKQRVDVIKSFVDKTFVKENMLFVRIFLSSLTEQRVVEELSYTTENFVSDIGGQLGLWAGISVLSACEVVELIVIICGVLYLRPKKRKRVEDSASRETPVEDINCEQ